MGVSGPVELRARGDPAPEKRSLRLGHLREVADRHGARLDRLLVDACGRSLDSLWGVEHHARRGCANPGMGGLVGVAGNATHGDHLLGIREAHRRVVRLRRDGARRDRDGECREKRTGRREKPRRETPAMPQVEEVPDEYARRHDRCQHDQPCR